MTQIAPTPAIAVADHPVRTPAERFPALAPRPMYWRRALRALIRLMRKEYDSAAIGEYTCALDGGDGERAFQAFLRQPRAAELIAASRDLPALLDDREALAGMPTGSLGRAFGALAERDGIRVRMLADAVRLLPDDVLLRPDATRCWFSDRGVAAHDLIHVLTGYERDEPGESLLIAFSIPQHPLRIFRISLFLTLLVAPKRRWLAFVADLVRAWRRGCAASLPYDTPWEELLPLPLDEARRRLSIQPFATAHPRGAWVRLPDGAGWRRILPSQHVASVPAHGHSSA